MLGFSLPFQFWFSVCSLFFTSLFLFSYNPVGFLIIFYNCIFVIYGVFQCIIDFFPVLGLLTVLKLKYVSMYIYIFIFINIYNVFCQLYLIKLGKIMACKKKKTQIFKSLLLKLQGFQGLKVCIYNKCSDDSSAVVYGRYFVHLGIKPF